MPFHSRCRRLIYRRFVAPAGLEPARPSGLRILNPLRLPIPPGGPARWPMGAEPEEGINHCRVLK